VSYFRIDEPVCATCSGWLGGRTVIEDEVAVQSIKAFQGEGLCQASHSFVAATSHCLSHAFLTRDR